MMGEGAGVCHGDVWGMQGYDNGEGGGGVMTEVGDLPGLSLFLAF